MRTPLRLAAPAVLAFLVTIGCGGGGTDPGPPGPTVDTTVIALRDTISGRINAGGEVHYLTFSLTAGQLFRVYAQGDGGFSITGPTGATIGAVFIPMPLPPRLLNASSPLLQAAQTGQYAVRVGALGPFSYRVFVYDVNPSPETATAPVGPGDSIVTELLEAPGDIDIFTLQIPSGTDTINLAYLLPLQLKDSLRVQILTLDSTSLFYQWKSEPAFDAQNRAAGSGPILLTGGTYRLSVNASGVLGAPVPYRLQVNNISAATELGSDSLVLGAPTTAALEPIGDLDVFRVRGRANQSFIPQFMGFAPGVVPPGFTVYLELGQPFGDSDWPGSPPRVSFPADSVYTLTVQPTAEGRDARQHGPYTLTLMPADTMPEVAAPVVSLGSMVNTEGLGSQGDLDRFSAAAAPGSEVQLLFRSLGPQSPGELLIAQWLGDSGDVLVGEQAGLTTTWGLGRRVTPPSGKLRFQFGWQRNSYGAPKWSFGYEFRVVTIARAPEVAGPTLLLGDTVTVESLDPIGDIDEFQYAGTAGDTIRVFTDFAIDGIFAGGGLIVELIEPGQTAPFLADTTSEQFHFPPFLTPPAVLPSTGSYTVRIRGAGNLGDRVVEGAYNIAVVP